MRTNFPAFILSANVKLTIPNRHKTIFYWLQASENKLIIYVDLAIWFHT